MRWLRTGAALAALTMAVAACGSDAKDAATTSRATTPATSAAATTVPGTTPGTATPLPADAPKRIISLSPSATEILFAIGAGDQILAVDDQSNFPAEALQKPHDLSGFTPDAEAIAALKPDLVVIANDSSGLTAQLGKVGIDVLVGDAPADFDGMYAQIEQIGAKTGHVADAAKLVADMQTKIKAAVDSVAKPATALTYYHELDNTYYSVTSHTFIGQIYALFGMKNIADGVQAGNDYPQLSSEYIVKASPDLIFLADTKCCKESPATVAARPGWSAIAAVKNHGVIAMDDDIASRWGPRVVDYIEAVAKAIAAVPVPAG